MIKRKYSILVVALLILILFILAFIVYTINERKGSILTNSNNITTNQSQMSKEQSVDDSGIKETTETRSVQVLPDEEYIVDIDNISFKTDAYGTLKGNISYTQSTLTEEQRIVYGFLEDNNSPIKIELDGDLAPHHTIDTPKEGTKTIPFALKDLPPGDHILYIVSEKVLNDNISDPLEIASTQKSVAANYFSLKVNNKNKDKTANTERTYSTAKVVKELEIETSEVMKLYEDSNLTKEVVSELKNDKYFLTIKNPYDFELNARFKLISEYEPSDLQDVNIPANSKVIVPINLKSSKLYKSARVLMLAEPAKDMGLSYAARFIKVTNRFKVEN
ncbi:hypothetical protein NDK25_24355 [Niallia taxi]|nr:hypothetical protein [Niallia taxi]